MMGGDAAFGNPPGSFSPDWARRSRRRAAAALPRLRRDRWRARRGLRHLLGGDDLLRATVVRRVRPALSAPDGRGGGWRGRRAQAAELGPGTGGPALRQAQPPAGAGAEARR